MANHLDPGPPRFELFDFEINANGGVDVLVEAVVGEPKEAGNERNNGEGGVRDGGEIYN